MSQGHINASFIPAPHGLNAEVVPPVWTALIRTSGLIRRLSEPHFARHGLSAAQWGVLRSLARLEQGGRPEPRMHELGAVLLVHPPSLSATLERMSRAGLITRREDPADHRSRLIGMTPAGRERLRQGLAEHAAWVEGMLAPLSATQRDQLAGLLATLCDHFGGLAGASTRPDGRPLQNRRPSRSEA